MDSEGRDIFAIDAQRDGKRFIVRTDETLAAFVELEPAIPGQPASSQNADAAALPDAQLSAPALHLPTPRATG
jgi:hypothetical protein